MELPLYLDPAVFRFYGRQILLNNRQFNTVFSLENQAVLSMLSGALTFFSDIHLLCDNVASCILKTWC